MPVLLILDRGETWERYVKAIRRQLTNIPGLEDTEIVMEINTLAEDDLASAANLSTLRTCRQANTLGDAGSILCTDIGACAAYNLWKTCYPIVALDDYAATLGPADYTQIMGRASRVDFKTAKTFGLYSPDKVDDEGMLTLLRRNDKYPQEAEESSEGESE